MFQFYFCIQILNLNGKLHKFRWLSPLSWSHPCSYLMMCVSIYIPSQQLGEDHVYEIVRTTRCYGDRLLLMGWHSNQCLTMELCVFIQRIYDMVMCISSTIVGNILTEPWILSRSFILTSAHNDLFGFPSGARTFTKKTNTSEYADPRPTILCACQFLSRCSS